MSFNDLYMTKPKAEKLNGGSGRGIVRPLPEIGLSGSRPTEYWGARQICKRMGWRSKDTLRRMAEEEVFPCFKRRRGSHGRVLWYSDEFLVRTWLLYKCKLQWEQLQREKQGKG